MYEIDRNAIRRQTMNNEIEVGEYVRTRDGYIAKVIEIDEDGDYYTFDNYVQVDHGDKFYSLYKEELKNVKTHSKNKIELVEERRLR